MSTELQDAWTAGFFDGEGSVVVSVSSGKGQTWTSLHVTLSQQDKEPLLLMKKWYGGNIVKGRSSGEWRKKAFTMCHRWVVYNEVAVQFLMKIRPYTILKSQEIDLAIQWPTRSEDGKQYRGAWNPMPKEVKEKRFQIRQGLVDIRSVRRQKNELSDAKERKEVLS